MSFHLNQQLIKTAQALTDGEKFFTGALAIKAEKLAEAFPYDNTVMDMYHFLDRRSQKASMISRAELKETYDKLYTLNNKFGAAFESELGFPKVAEMKKQASEEAEIDADAFLKSKADPFLANALAAVFDSKQPFKPYSVNNGKIAIEYTKNELKKIALVPQAVDVATGNEKFIICRATYQTPKGDVVVLLPLKTLAEGELLPPGTFCKTQGLVELNAENLEKHIKESAGKALKVHADQLLAGLSKRSSALSPLEEAVFRIKTAKESANLIDHIGIVYQTQDFFHKEATELKDPVYELPEEFKSFGEQLASKAGEAQIVFGKQALATARDFVVKTVKDLGYSSQVRVAGIAKDKIIFAAEVNGHGFKVPVLIEGNKVFEPKIAIFNGKVKSLSPDMMTELLSDRVDHSATKYAEMPVNEVCKQFHQSLHDGNSDLADKLLNVLHDKDLAAFGEGLELYKKVLGGEKIGTAPKCSHSMIQKGASQETCLHTGLPVNRVYQDKFGNCKPLYRQALEGQEVKSSMAFNHNKLYW